MKHAHNSYLLIVYDGVYLKILSISLFLVYFLIISSILLNDLSSAADGLPVAVSVNVYIACVSSLKHNVNGLRRRKRRKRIGKTKKKKQRKGMKQETLYSLQAEETKIYCSEIVQAVPARPPNKVEPYAMTN